MILTTDSDNIETHRWKRVYPYPWKIVPDPTRGNNDLTLPDPRVTDRVEFTGGYRLTRYPLMHLHKHLHIFSLCNAF